MRNVLLSLVSLSAGFSGAAYAQQSGYGAAGCGLGALVFGPTEGIEQIFAATLNGTAGSQTFGITSGTSNCKAGGKRTLVGSQEDFFQNNYSTITREAAQGNGESLVAMASTFGCNASSQAQFSKHLQSNYGALFASSMPLEALASTRNSLQSNPELSKNCKNIAL
jgi:hypothetical protein